MRPVKTFHVRPSLPDRLAARRISTLQMDQLAVVRVAVEDRVDDPPALQIVIGAHVYTLMPRDGNPKLSLSVCPGNRRRRPRIPAYVV